MIASSLKIMLWDKEIGRLYWDTRRGVSFFEYNPAFLGGRLDPFPLVASVKSPASRRPIMGDRETKLYRKLPPFLADSLPDAWGNQVFECWRIQNGIRNQEITPLEILSFIGKRGMGALEFIPESSGIRKSEKLNMKALTDIPSWVNNFKPIICDLFGEGHITFVRIVVALFDCNWLFLVGHIPYIIGLFF